MIPKYLIENYIFSIKPFKGSYLKDIDLRELDKWLGWAEDEEKPSLILKTTIRYVTAYLALEEVAARLEVELHD